MTPPLHHFFPLVSARFVGDHNSILTFDSKKTQRLWELHVEERPADELDLFSRFMSGEIASPSDAVALDNKAVSNCWIRLRSTRPEDFMISTDYVVEWHNFRAQQSELDGNWRAAQFHWRRLSSLLPADDSVKERLKATEERAGNEQ